MSDHIRFFHPSHRLNEHLSDKFSRQNTPLFLNSPTEPVRGRRQASAPLLPTQNLLSSASTFLWKPMRFAFGIPIFKKVLSLSASEGFRREIASGIPKKLINLSCFQPNSTKVTCGRPRARLKLI